MVSIVEPSWQRVLAEQFQESYFQNLLGFIQHRKAAGVDVYPPEEQWFSALEITPFEKVKVVILGQDPYHAAGQAHGLSFSVPLDTKIPPSLRNIYKELHADVGIEIPSHGFLLPWAQQGVLLLNSVLTVEGGAAGSHQGRGWELFTDAIIQELNKRREALVFLLWGSHAQKKGASIDRVRHLVLEAPHPSPLSAHRGFFGCQHFSKANTYLLTHNQSAIDWQL